MAYIHIQKWDGGTSGGGNINVGLFQKPGFLGVTLPVHQTEGGSQRVRSRDPLRLGEFLESPRKTRGSLIYISTAREEEYHF